MGGSFGVNGRLFRAEWRRRCAGGRVGTGHFFSRLRLAVCAEMATFAARTLMPARKNFYTMYGFNLGIDIFTTFALPWLGLAVGFVLGWLVATVRQMRKQQK